jgi:chromosome partitioning protein
MLVIACLSQKGGVGKSTFSRLIATAYAHSGWAVKIADFNTKQKTSTDWVAMRLEAGIKPEVAAETFSGFKAVAKQGARYDLVVCDGRPDSDVSSLEIAKEADLIVIPVGVALDDLRPQVLFAHELSSKGVDKRKMLFIINRTVESQIACDDARAFVEGAGYGCAATDIPLKTAYQIAQNSGRSLMETNFSSLNRRAASLMGEIVKLVGKNQKAAA